jgi:hypothetical protein
MGEIVKFIRRRRKRRVPQPGMVSGRHWAMVGMLGIAVAGTPSTALNAGEATGKGVGSGNEWTALIAR